MPAVVKATVEHEKYEGYFRYAHANIRTNSESLAFCGTDAAIFEKDQQVHTFDLSQHSFLLSECLVLEIWKVNTINSYLFPFM